MKDTCRVPVDMGVRATNFILAFAELPEGAELVLGDGMFQNQRCVIIGIEDENHVFTFDEVLDLVASFEECAERSDPDDDDADSFEILGEHLKGLVSDLKAEMH